MVTGAGAEAEAFHRARVPLRLPRAPAQAQARARGRTRCRARGGGGAPWEDISHGGDELRRRQVRQHDASSAAAVRQRSALRTSTAVQAVPQLTALAFWGGLPRLLAPGCATHSGERCCAAQGSGVCGAAVRPCRGRRSPRVPSLFPTGRRPGGCVAAVGRVTGNGLGAC